MEKTQNNNNQHQHHHHHDTSNLSGTKIFFVTLFNAIITTAEIIGGLISGSLSLLSDAVHNLSDTLAIAASYIANRISKRPRNEKKTYGYKRVEIITAFVNAGILLGLTVLLIYEGINRFFNPESIKGSLMLIVASIGLLGNLLSVLFLQRDASNNLNIKASYLHLLSDTISSVAVIFGGLAIMLWNIYWIDPLLTILIGLYIFKHAWQVVKEATNILMQSAPDLDFEELQANLLDKFDIIGVHHLHAWLNDEHSIFFSAHLDLKDITLSKVDKILEDIEKYLKEMYGIYHITLQPEFARCDGKGVIC